MKKPIKYPERTKKGKQVIASRRLMNELPIELVQKLVSPRLDAAMWHEIKGLLYDSDPRAGMFGSACPKCWKPCEQKSCCGMMLPGHEAELKALGLTGTLGDPTDAVI